MSDTDKVFPGGSGVTPRVASELISDDMIIMGTSDEELSLASAYQTKYSEILLAIRSQFWQVGDCLPIAGDTAPSHWLMLNGDTIGSAASGATVASDELDEVFGFLWDTYDNADCPVSSGRGASAQADWDADKTLTLPDVNSINSNNLVGIRMYAGGGPGNSGFGGGK